MQSQILKQYKYYSNKDVWYNTFQENGKKGAIYDHYYIMMVIALIKRMIACFIARIFGSTIQWPIKWLLSLMFRHITIT